MSHVGWFHVEYCAKFFRKWGNIPQPWHKCYWQTEKYREIRKIRKIMDIIGINKNKTQKWKKWIKIVNLSANYLQKIYKFGGNRRRISIEVIVSQLIASILITFHLCAIWKGESNRKTHLDIESIIFHLFSYSRHKVSISSTKIGFPFHTNSKLIKFVSFCSISRKSCNLIWYMKWSQMANFEKENRQFRREATE